MDPSPRRATVDVEVRGAIRDATDGNGQFVLHAKIEECEAGKLVVIADAPGYAGASKSGLFDHALACVTEAQTVDLSLRRFP